MDVVLIGLPGSGKSVVGRRLANRHAAVFIDLDERIESTAGRTISQIFEDGGESTFRALERAAIAGLGPPDSNHDVQRVIATGGGAIVDPRNRWTLYRGRTTIWLDGRPEVLAQRLRRSPRVRPLVSGNDPIGAIRGLAARRERFYAAATVHQVGVAEVHGVVDAVEERLDEAIAGTSGTTLLRASTSIGRIVLGDGIAVEAVAAELDTLRARRAILISEPGAWAAVGERLATSLRERGREVVHFLLPEGEAAKRLDVVETAARELATRRVERAEVLVAIGGGALGDTAGFLAAIYLRGIRFIQVPTTLVAQIDSAIGGKTGVDLPQGKNLIGAFHQPREVFADTDVLTTLPERELSCGLAEIIKYGLLADRVFFDWLEANMEALRRRDPQALTHAIYRSCQIKAQIVGRDIEAATGYVEWLHGEAVGVGLLLAASMSQRLGALAAADVARVATLLERAGLRTTAPQIGAATAADFMRIDKKVQGGRVRLVLLSSLGAAYITGDYADDALHSTLREHFGT